MFEATKEEVKNRFKIRNQKKHIDEFEASLIEENNN